VLRVLSALIAAAYLTLAVGVLGSDGSVLALITGAVFAVLATAGFERVRRRNRLGLSAAYVVVQLLVAYVTFGLSGAAVGGILLLVALVSQAALLLPFRWVVPLVAVVPFIHLGMDLHAGLREGVGTLAAVAFAALLTQLLVREQRAREQLQAYALQAERLAATQERNRVARDIHDGLGHALTVVQMQVKAARAVLGSDVERADAMLAKAQHQAEEALAEIRRSVSALREPRSIPLPDALRELADQMSAAGVPTTVEIAGAARSLGVDAQESLYRAAQEGLTNVRKHARATSAGLTLDYSQPSSVRLEVRDDGTGLAETAEVGAPSGFGLLGVRERAAHLGGRMSIESMPGRGSTLRVEVPG
jgi:signal transduction histidine kinase